MVMMIYLNFSKAFDKLNHKILLAKLNLFSFSSGLINFFFGLIFPIDVNMLSALAIKLIDLK